MVYWISLDKSLKSQFTFGGLIKALLLSFDSVSALSFQFLIMITNAPEINCCVCVKGWMDSRALVSHWGYYGVHPFRVD